MRYYRAKMSLRCCNASARGMLRCSAPKSKDRANSEHAATDPLVSKVNPGGLCHTNSNQKTHDYKNSLHLTQIIILRLSTRKYLWKYHITGSKIIWKLISLLHNLWNADRYRLKWKGWKRMNRKRWHQRGGKPSCSHMWKTSWSWQMSVTTVDVGGEAPLDIVCGAPMYKQVKKVSLQPSERSCTCLKIRCLKSKSQIRGPHLKEWSVPKMKWASAKVIRNHSIAEDTVVGLPLLMW